MRQRCFDRIYRNDRIGIEKDPYCMQRRIVDRIHKIDLIGTGKDPYSLSVF